MRITERDKWIWAVEQQGYTGTFAAWQRLSVAARAEYEQGAAGIPTPEMSEVRRRTDDEEHNPAPRG